VECYSCLRVRSWRTVHPRMKLYQMIDIFDEHKNFRCSLLFCSAFVSFLKSNRLKSIRIGYSAAFQNKRVTQNIAMVHFIWSRFFSKLKVYRTRSFCMLYLYLPSTTKDTCLSIYSTGPFTSQDDWTDVKHLIWQPVIILLVNDLLKSRNIFFCKTASCKWEES